EDVAQDAQKGADVEAFVIVFARLEKAPQRNGDDQREGRSVDDDGEAPFEQVGCDDVGAFGSDDLGEGRIGVVFDQLFKHGAVDDGVDVNPLDPPFHFLDDGVRRQVADIANRDVGAGDAADAHGLDFELRRADAPADQRSVAA